MPPSAGASIGTTAMPIVTQPIIDAASSWGTMSRTMARLSTMPTTIDACAMRNARNTSAVVAKMQPSDATT